MHSMPRQSDGRALDALRPAQIETGFISQAPGSVLITMGKTRVICVASLLEGVPSWLEGRGLGWVTAEYAMLPYATQPRGDRERGQSSARSQEIRRLIGRSLRMVVDRAVLGERTIVVDCDVIEADGGTRTAAVTGGYVALAMALRMLKQEGVIDGNALVRQIAAVSVGIVEGTPMLDLAYTDDVRAQVDLNVVMTSDGGLIEVQGTGEGASYTRNELDELLGLAERGISELMVVQREALEAL